MSKRSNATATARPLDDAEPFHFGPSDSLVEGVGMKYSIMGRHLDAVPVHDAIEALYEALARLTAFKNANFPGYERLAKRLGDVIGEVEGRCEDLEETIREEFSRKARRRRQGG